MKLAIAHSTLVLLQHLRENMLAKKETQEGQGLFDSQLRQAASQITPTAKNTERKTHPHFLLFCLLAFVILTQLRAPAYGMMLPTVDWIP